MLPFWISILALSLGQGLTVAVPGVLKLPFGDRLNSRWWALIPAASVIAFVFGVRAAEESAQGLTYLALVAVPLLAVLALGGLARGGRPLLGLLVAPLFALAWADPSGLAGEAAAAMLTALSCVALGVLIATVTPRSWLAVGIVLMAMADTALVVSDLLQSPNEALNAARPVANLPRLQSAVFGTAVMGYGDLFVAAALGALLATYGRALQLRGALLAMVIASLFDLLFFAVSELPATVPIALTLIIVLALRRARSPRGTGGEHGGVELELKPQVYLDERPSEVFDPLYDWALEHEPGWMFDVTRMLFMPFCMILFRLRSVDAACVPSSGPAIIAPNHFSVMDHFFCGVYLRRRVRFMAKSQLFSGVLRVILPRLGAFPVQRGKQDERSIQTALGILRKGGVIVVYPEGGRSRSGVVGQARPGVGRLALESGAPVVPVAIGSERARNWKRLEFHQVTVRYGEPLRFAVRSDPSPAEGQAVAEDILARVRELHETLTPEQPARSRLVGVGGGSE